MMRFGGESIERLKDKITELLGNEKTRTYIIIGGTAVIAALYISFAIIPKATQLAKVTRKVTDLRDKIDLVTGRVKRLDSITRRLEELRQEQAGYAKKLPPQKEIPEFLEGLANMARASRVKILSITPSPLRSSKAGGKTDEYFLEMPVSITARSGYHELGRFVSDLERGERLIIIKDLNIKNNPGDPWMHNVRMLINAYVSVE